MIQKPIYKPKGRAQEYCEYAINIYGSCNHGCLYCWARDMAKRCGKPWTGEVNPRRDIVESVKRQIDKEKITGKLIQCCFTCDPYPKGYDSTATREIIKAIKVSGNHVQILTKNGDDTERDLDLLDGNDWLGVTVSCNEGVSAKIEPKADDVYSRIAALSNAYDEGIKTWVSFEPVLTTDIVYRMIAIDDFVGKFAIGKLNYHKPEDFGCKPINWGEFGRECERLCKEHGREYYIKADLRAAMGKDV